MTSHTIRLAQPSDAAAVSPSAFTVPMGYKVNDFIAIFLLVWFFLHCIKSSKNRQVFSRKFVSFF